MNQSCYELRDKANERGYYTYFATRNLVAILQQRVHGAVFDTITRDMLRGVSVAMPIPKLIEAFEAEGAPIFERIFVNLYESCTLASVRDALLPRLISGELRVPDAGRMVEAALESPAKRVEHVFPAAYTFCPDWTERRCRHGVAVAGGEAEV